ncbi:NUDIX hydrolase [uncultured Ramlibacter sp.]|uniref:NUDIX domain-containing protein n=1 Tax=uncultured Ramlibacter sp. TaxID=260755 RepID=UPI0026189C6C|nr:NUDIX hydrolase [uncultured Ramlibacter sp.]
MSTGDDTHLVERHLASQELLKGGFLHVVRDTVALPDGSTGTREYVRHPGAVVVVPMLDDGRVVVERQYRYPISRVVTEFPAGKLDAGEDPLVCGKRELLEETGYSAREWARAGEMHNAIAYSDEVIHIYFARGLQAGQRKLDQGEFLDVLAVPPSQLFEAAQRGELTDAKTLTCMLWLQNVLAGTWVLDWQS